MAVIPSGFLVPSKTKGALTVFDLNTKESMQTAYQLTSGDDSDWFYHRALWLDMDGDGKEDLVTCRAKKPIFGQQKGELLWFKQPDTATPWSQKWEKTILYKSLADTFLISVQIKSGHKTVQAIITAGYFSKSLVIWWRTDESKPWTSDNLEKRIIDSGVGNTFDVIHADLNGDGVAELLVTYNRPSNGTVFVYETSGDFRMDTVKKHMIMSGLTPAKRGTGKGAPGGIQLTWPDLRKTKGRPDIILSGDDDGKIYLLRANDSTSWKYTATALLDASPGTVGAMAVGDINNDYYPEIIVPLYNDNKITILSYNPLSHQQNSQTNIKPDSFGRF
ncbi:uncharacterized protein [Watersipora subatra]|uniref:uncharacterized protein n=1 Tax=Watersipora subatra TaxID=2589382 RepID=UPI00355BD791